MKTKADGYLITEPEEIYVYCDGSIRIQLEEDLKVELTARMSKHLVKELQRNAQREGR